MRVHVGLLFVALCAKACVFSFASVSCPWCCCLSDGTAIHLAISLQSMRGGSEISTHGFEKKWQAFSATIFCSCFLDCCFLHRGSGLQISALFRKRESRWQA